MGAINAAIVALRRWYYVSMDSIEVFVQVVRAGSISEAARRLGMPKSTVSLRLAELESRLGVALLKRTTRKVEPTDAGAAYFATAARVLSELRAAEEDVSGVQNEPRGRLRISTSASLGVGPVGHWVTELLRRHPQLEIELHLSEHRIDLLAEGFDIAVRTGRLADDARLRAKRLGSSYLKLFASPRYLHERQTPRHPRDLEAHDFVCAPSRDHLELVHEDGERVHVQLKGQFRSHQLVALRHQAIAGVGIVSLPTAAAEEEVRRGLLTPLLTEWGSDAVPVHVVYAKQRFVPAKVRAFLELAAQELPRSPDP